jgi:hypothetical protein
MYIILTIAIFMEQSSNIGKALIVFLTQMQDFALLSGAAERIVFHLMGILYPSTQLS